MYMRSFAVLGASLLLAAMFANATSRNNVIEIKVLGSQTQSSVAGDNGVAKNCDQVTFDAYCRSSRSVPLINTLVVQEADGPPFRVTCTAESKWSRCVPLEAGSSFEAKKEKHGITIYYVDGRGKARSQLYTLLAGESMPPAGKSVPSPAAATTSPVAAPGPAAISTPAAAPVPTAAPSVAAGAQPESSGQALPAGTMTMDSPKATVKCSFSSTPSGAEVTVDGRYVGSTPSVLGMTTGTHVVVVSMAGFAQWKRELAVTPGSELTVNAVLQKTQ